MSVPSNAPTRDKIVAAATDLVIERGYDKTTMRAIAERAGVSLGSAYYYFGGKEELIQGIYLRITDEHEAVARQRMDGVKDFGKRLELCVGAYLDVSSRYRTISDSLLALDKLLRLGQVPLMRPFFKDAIAILKMLDGRGDHAGLVRA